MEQIFQVKLFINQRQTWVKVVKTTLEELIAFLEKEGYKFDCVHAKHGRKFIHNKKYYTIYIQSIENALVELNNIFTKTA